MEIQGQPGEAVPSQNREAVAESAAVAAPPAAASAAGEPPPDAFSRTFSSVLNAGASFMSLAGKEWFSSLLNQPMDPPFSHNTKFEGQFDRVIRLVVVVILLTAVVVGSVRLIADKTAAFEVVRLSMWVLILAFLVAIAYAIFAFICGVRVCENENRRKLTVAQILYTILYIFVPWIPIIAFLWITAPSGGPFRLLILTIFFYLCVGYMILNFAKGLSRLTKCSRLRIWVSILLPFFLVLIYLLRSTASA